MVTVWVALLSRLEDLPGFIIGVPAYKIVICWFQIHRGNGNNFERRVQFMSIDTNIRLYHHVAKNNMEKNDAKTPRSELLKEKQKKLLYLREKLAFFFSIICSRVQNPDSRYRINWDNIAFHSLGCQWRVKKSKVRIMYSIWW